MAASSSAATGRLPAVVAVGASAGGVEALVSLVRRLPGDLPAAVFVVLHVPAGAKSALPGILSRAGPLLAEHATDGQRILPGRIYVAPPDHHLLLHDGHVKLSSGPRENRHRPAIDPLFRSAARARGAAVVGVLLSGASDDGTGGLLAIKLRGGKALAQDPRDALHSRMPASAIEHVDVDHVAPAADMGPLIGLLVADLPSAEPLHDAAEPPEPVDMDQNEAVSRSKDAPPSGQTCPECHGALWENHDGGLLSYECRTGHRFSVESLLGEQSEALEEALWSAVRALEEQRALLARLAERAVEGGRDPIAQRFRQAADAAEQKAELVRRALAAGLAVSTGTDEA